VLTYEEFRRRVTECLDASVPAGKARVHFDRGANPDRALVRIEHRFVDVSDSTYAAGGSGYTAGGVTFDPSPQQVRVEMRGRECVGVDCHVFYGAYRQWVEAGAGSDDELLARIRDEVVAALQDAPALGYRSSRPVPPGATLFAPGHGCAAVAVVAAAVLLIVIPLVVRACG